MFEHRSLHTESAHDGSLPHSTAVLGDLRSRLLRVAVLPAVALGALCAAAAALVVAAGSPWTVSTVVTGWLAGCAAVLLVVVRRVNTVVRALRRQYDDAVSTASADPPHRSAFGDAYGQQRRVFINLAGRLQSLIQRTIVKVDELEHTVEDPDLLKGLFNVDHLATRVRRQAENLAVLGGEPPQRQASSPVSMYAVLRSAVAEIEHYARVKVAHPVEDTLHGHAVAEFIHLLAELLENATSFSPPDAPVLVRAQKVTAGMAIEVQDRGLGIPSEDLDRINHLLGESSSRLDLGELFEDGRIGLSVVRELAHRHGINVRLQPNIFGGIDAAVVLPHRLLGEVPNETEPPHSSRPVRQEPRTNQELRTNMAGELHEPAPEPGAPAPTSPPRGAQPKPDGATPGQFPHLPGTPATPAEPPAQGTTSAPPTEQDTRPPLPKRNRAASHMPPELRKRSGTNPIPDHNPTLMATFRNGLDHGSDTPDGPADHSDLTN